MKYNFLSKCIILSLFIAMSTSTLSHLQAMVEDRENLTASPSLKKPQTFAGLPQINIDEFDEVTMAHILKTYGSFEVIGPSIDELSKQALEALQESKQVLNLPLESLEKVYHKHFNGFQNVHRETSEAFQLDGKGPILNQIAFHFKPYLEPQIPEGIKELKACANYHAKATAILYRLYNKIADSFIKPEQKTIFKENRQTSCLTLRKYFSGKKSESGTTAHTDFSLLTLVVSDRDGLEILEGKNISEGRWLKAPCGGLNKPRFYINVGDWLFLQIDNEEFGTGTGVHRVSNVEEDRYSLILFLNPTRFIKSNQKLKTLEGVEIDYIELHKAYQHEGWPL